MGVEDDELGREVLEVSNAIGINCHLTQVVFKKSSSVTMKHFVAVGTFIFTLQNGLINGMGKVDNRWGMLAKKRHNRFYGKGGGIFTLGYQH